jgi:hypothetical protein
MQLDRPLVIDGVAIYEEDTYGNAFDKITDVIIMKGSTPDNIANDGNRNHVYTI